MRQIADLAQEIAHGRRLAGERHLHARGRIETALLSQVADRAHDIDERAEALLEGEVALACHRPGRDHERRRLAGFPGALPKLQRDRLGEERHRRMQQPQ